MNDDDSTWDDDYDALVDRVLVMSAEGRRKIVESAVWADEVIAASYIKRVYGDE